MPADPSTIAVYEAQAERYAEFDVTASQSRAMDMFCAELGPMASVLDLGCGPGIQGAALMARGMQVTGLEPTPAFVSAARTRGLTVRQGTFDDIDQMGAFDGLWASFSLLHAPRADFQRYLNAAVARVRPDGAVFLGMKLGAGERRDELGRLYTYYTIEELTSALREAGATLTWHEEGAEAGLSGTVDSFVHMVARCA